MIITHFNRYFEKHGRKTYIVLGIIISLMFVVFVTPGDVFSGGAGGSNDFGSIYGKKLNRQFITKKMAETYIGLCIRYPQAMGQDFGTEILYNEALNRMRFLHEAQKRKMTEVSKQEIAEAIRANGMFQENGKFSAEYFHRFTERFLQPRGLVAMDFDRIVKENIIIERLENEITATAKVDEAEVAGYVEKYTAKVADFQMDLNRDFQPSEEEISAFFANRKGELKMPDSKAAVIASFAMQDLIAKAAKDANLKKTIEPSEADLKAQFEAYKDRAYKDKTFDEVKGQIAQNLRNRNARRVQEGIANNLREKFTVAVKNESEGERLARFTQEAEKLGAKIIKSGFISGKDAINGMEGRQTNLVNAINKLDGKGQVTELTYSATGIAVACLSEIQPATLPAEITAEVRTLIQEALLTEKALAFYQQTVAPYSESVGGVTDRRELAYPKFEAIQKDLTLSDEEKQTKLKEAQDEISEYVYPFFKDERRSFALVSFQPEKLLADVSEQDIDLEAGYAKRADEYQKKQVRLAKIVVKTDGLDEAAKQAKKTKLAEALAKLQAGEEFAAVAANYSDEKEVEEKELQDIAKLAPELAAEMATLQAGQLSGLIQTPAAFLIVKVLERNDGRTLDQVKEELTLILRQEKSVQLAFEAALDFANRISEGWWKATESNAEFDGVKVLAATAKEGKGTAFDFVEMVRQGDMVSREIGQEPALMREVFERTLKEPLTGAIKGEKASYVAFLQGVEQPSLSDPATDALAMNTLKSIFRRKVALEATFARATAAAETIAAALKDGKEFNAAAGNTVFADLPSFSRMEPGNLSQIARLSDVGTSLLAISKAQPGTLLEPQKTYSGYALIYLVSKEMPEDEATKQMLENVRGYILRREQQKVMSDFMAKLEEESETRIPEAFQAKASR